MNGKKTSNSPRTLGQLKKEKGQTCWAKLVAEERGSNKKIQPTQKTRG